MWCMAAAEIRCAHTHPTGQRCALRAAVDSVLPAAPAAALDAVRGADDDREAVYPTHRAPTGGADGV